MSITKLCDYCVKPAVYTDSSSRPGRRLMNETD